ncbi:MAG: dihydrolipoyl dehydrogenase, partial [Deltaproteobacteria bacterium CG07_land_8_20_14_0_80_38_7]
EGIAIVHTDENETIIGAHFFGKNATLLVAEATLAIQKQTKINEIEHIIHAHPTLSEVFAEAMLDANGMAIHKIGKD